MAAAATAASTADDGNGFEKGVLGRTTPELASFGRSVNGNDGVVGESRRGEPLRSVWLHDVHADGCGGCFENRAGGRALSITGNAVQSRDGGGIVKAMVMVDEDSGRVPLLQLFLNGSPVSTPPCGFSISSNRVGLRNIDFGFRIDDRFFFRYSGSSQPTLETSA